jgi:hypothetical protein
MSEDSTEPKKIGETIDSESRVHKFVCENTGTIFEAEQVMFGGEWFPEYRFCEEETDRLIAEEKEKDRLRKQDEWRLRMRLKYEKECPQIMKETDHSRLPQGPLGKVLGWKYQPRGMILHGESGTGKTRCVWAKIKQRADEGYGWTYYSSRRLSDLLLKSVFDKTHDRFMSDLTRTPLLFIDDLGKEKVGDKWMTDLFDIVDRRCEEGKPIIITTNYNGDKLEQRILRANPEHDETCKALLRRFKEFYHSVSFQGAGGVQK